jgi:hypothetical protein
MLWNFFQNTNSWLKYAEQKHYYLQIVIMAQLAGLGIFLDNETFKPESPNIVWAGVLVMMCSVLWSAISMLPYDAEGQHLFKFFKMPAKRSTKKQYDLVLCHSHMVKYTFSAYKNKLKAYIGTSGGLCSRQYELLSDMCLVNARIWHIKFQFFSSALWINISGLIIVLAGMFVPESFYKIN